MAEKGVEIASTLQGFRVESLVLPDMLTERLLLETLMDNARSDPSMALVCTAVTELQEPQKTSGMAAGKLDPIISQADQIRSYEVISNIRVAYDEVKWFYEFKRRGDVYAYSGLQLLGGMHQDKVKDDLRMLALTARDSPGLDTLRRHYESLLQFPDFNKFAASLNSEETSYLIWEQTFNEGVVNWRGVFASQVFTEDVTSAGTPYQVIFQTNSTVTDVSYDESMLVIKFTVTGPNNSRGFCGVVIPKKLISGTPVVLIDNREVPCQYVEQYDSYTVYFTYPHSTREVKVGGSNTIPEFQNYGLLVIVTILLLLMISRRIFADPLLRKRLPLSS